MKKLTKMKIKVVKMIKNQYQAQNYQIHQRIMFMSKTNKHNKKKNINKAQKDIDIYVNIFSFLNYIE